MIDATVVQARPTAPDTEQDVGRFVVTELTTMGLPGVAHDHESRIDFGEKKYGQRLRTNNGRDSLMEMYQEALDGISYAGQHQLEGHDDGTYLRLFSAVADRIKSDLLLREIFKDKEVTI